MVFQIVCAMAQYDNDRLNPSAAQMIDAGFDYRPGPERKQRFESTHSFRAAGGEDNGSDIFHDEKVTTKAQRHKDAELYLLTC
jgi:hypothetical protein